MDKYVRWGILGNAWIARDYVMPAMLSSPLCKVVAIASRSELPPDFYPDIRHIVGYDGLLDDPDIDAVYIPLPNALHFEWSLKAMRKGKHVLCEKPIALNAVQCEQMIQEAKDNRVILMEAFMYRYSRKMIKLKELLDSSVLGRIRGLHSHFGFMLDWESPARQDPKLGGGCLYDVGCYCIDCINMLMRMDGASLVDAGSAFRMKGGVDNHASAWLRYSNGVTATLDSWFDAYEHQALFLVGEKGTLCLSDPFNDKPSTMTLATSEVTKTIRVASGELYRLEVEAFSRAVLGGESDLVPLSDTLETMRALDLLYT